jgi:tetratricopeptide (TPR) repeat protein
MEWLRSNALREALTVLEDPWLVELARLSPEIRTHRPDLPAPQPIDEAWQRGRLYQALAQAFTRGDEALLLLLDDLQWCDQETLDWLAYLLRFASGRKLLVIGTLRLGDGVRSEALLGLRRQLRRGGRLSELELQPLDAAGTATLARQLAGQPLEPAAATHLFDETEGNPLFILESVRAGLGAAPGPGTRLTPKVQAVIETRLAGLSPLAGELVAIAATIGRSFTFEVLAQASKEEDEAVVDGLDELWQQRIVGEQGVGYDFTHHKLREVAYADLSSARRRLLHRRVGEALEWAHVADLAGVSGQIATHYEKAHAWHQALRYYVQSAENAAGLFAFHQAEGLYARAIDVAFRLNQPGEQLLQLYVQRGRMLESAGRFAEAVALYHDLEQLARQRWDPRIECVALAQLGACLIKPSRVHDRHKADRLIARGLSLARENELYEQEAHLLWSQMVLATHYAGTAQAQEAGQACIKIARQHGLEFRLSLALHDLSFNLRINGQLEEGDAYAQEARVLFRKHNNLPLLTDNLNQQALVSIQHLDFDSALGCAGEAGEISQQIENGWNRSYSLWLRGWAAAERGEWGRGPGADPVVRVHPGRERGRLFDGANGRAGHVGRVAAGPGALRRGDGYAHGRAHRQPAARALFDARHRGASGAGRLCLRRRGAGSALAGTDGRARDVG